MLCACCPALAVPDELPADHAGCVAQTIVWIIGLNALTIFFLQALDPLDRKSAIMEEDQLQERHHGIHGDEHTRKVQEAIPEVSARGLRS